MLHKIRKQMVYKNVIRWLCGAALVCSSNINDYITVFQTAQAFLLNYYYSRNEFVEIKHSGYCKLGKGDGRSFP